MHIKKSGVIKTISTLAAISATTAFAATTPYDLIRPVWPLSWDATVFDKFDVSVTKKTGMLPKNVTPESFKAGELMPDTLDQAYLDAINTKISPIRVNQAGYLKSDTERQFYFVGTKATEFEVVDAYGKSLSPKVTGTFTASETETQSDWTIIAGTNTATNDQMRYKVEFTGPSGKIFVGKIPQGVPTEKRLRIKVGEEFSSTFIVSDDVYTMAKDAALKFFGIQRSGNSESWFHAASHTKDGGGTVVNGRYLVTNVTVQEGDLQGGWYDCGDHLKESQTQAFAFMTLAVMAATNPAKDVDHYAYDHGTFVKTDGIPDVLREAKHGADFFLRAFRAAKGVVDDMAVSVGNFSYDHGWWGRPEAQDYVTATGRGGSAERDVRLGELGANVSAEIAAGLAILSRDYASYNKTFADSCLLVAGKMYDFAKALAQGKPTYDGGKAFTHNTLAAGWSSAAYAGNNEFADDLALASVALLYATGNDIYADDMIRTKNLFEKQATGSGAGLFEGGWFSTTEKGMLKNPKNTSWANSHAYALYALYKLILADSKKATSLYTLTEEERLNAIEDCLADMIYNLGDVSDGTGSIVLPAGDIGSKYNTVKYNPTWYTMQTDQVWLYNRYQMGNIFEILAYADVAADIEKQAIKLPKMASTGLKASEMRQLGINQLNYMFGVNPWDISLVYGVGDKNDAHPHHRASNPEGKNMHGLDYKYNCPVGALLGGLQPSNENSWNPENKMSWENFYISETCLDGTALLTSALTLVSNGGSSYIEKKCENCDTTEVQPFSGEVYATAFHYTFPDSIDYFSLHFFNETMADIDSVVAYIYFEATEEDVEACGAIFDEDICQVFDIAGFNRPCNNDRELREFMRANGPQKVEGTYNKGDSTYSWAQAINVGTIGFGTKLRLDIGISSGTKVSGKCETLRQPAKINVSDGWSFTSHAASNNAPAYVGTPTWDKDLGDYQEAPSDPYIVIRSKGKWLWGYGPGKTTSDGIVKVADIAKARLQVNNNKLYVLAPAQGTKTVKIFDLLGNQLMAKTFDGTRAEISLAKLSHRGTLIAKVMQNDRTLATQGIKVK